MRVAVGHQYHYEHQYSHLIHAAPQFNLNLFYLFISPSLPSTATPFHHSWEGLPLAVVWPGDRPESTEWKWKERWQKKNVSKSEMKTEIEDIEHCEENLNQNRNGNYYRNENNLLINLSKFPREKKQSKRKIFHTQQRKFTVQHLYLPSCPSYVTWSSLSYSSSNTGAGYSEK